jgi:hypothetical protein
MSPTSHRTCRGCGGVMELLSSARSRVLLYWCPVCHRIAERYRPEPPWSNRADRTRCRQASSLVRAPTKTFAISSVVIAAWSR